MLYFNIRTRNKYIPYWLSIVEETFIKNITKRLIKDKEIR
jgi:hypothetical protein